MGRQFEVAVLRLPCRRDLSRLRAPGTAAMLSKRRRRAALVGPGALPPPHPSRFVGAGIAQAVASRRVVRTAPLHTSIADSNIELLASRTFGSLVRLARPSRQQRMGASVEPRSRVVRGQPCASSALCDCSHFGASSRHPGANAFWRRPAPPGASASRRRLPPPGAAQRLPAPAPPGAAHRLPALAPRPRPWRPGLLTAPRSPGSSA